jgi:hypothetical protein
MPSEMRMNLARHPVRDTKGNLYKDFDANFNVLKSQDVHDSIDGLFQYTVHSKTKQYTHSGLGLHDQVHDHQISVIQKKHKETGQHFNTDYSVTVYPDKCFIKSLRAISKHVDILHREQFFMFVRNILIERQPRLISGTLHTLLVYNKPDFGATPTFEINSDGYQIDKDYDEPLDFKLESNNKIIGKDPYYISHLDLHPTARRPSTIETSIAKIDLDGTKKVGIFTGIKIKGTFDQITSAFHAIDIGKKIKQNDDEFPEWPSIVEPSLSIYMLTH